MALLTHARALPPAHQAHPDPLYPPTPWLWAGCHPPFPPGRPLTHPPLALLLRCAAPYLHSEYGEDFGREAPVRLLEKLLLGKKRFPEEHVVVVSQVLACDATIGYEDWSNVQVHSFNGTPVRNLQHLTEMVLEALVNKEPYLRFEVGQDVSAACNTLSCMMSS